MDHIKEGKLYAIKIQRDKQVYLIQRELNNYRNACYPLIPKFYGTIRDNNDTFIVIECISGRSLDKISEFHFTIEQKMSILCQLLFILDYLHQNNLIYRDLKPNNLFLDDNNKVILIDFDRMIKEKEHDNLVYTNDFAHGYIAPEAVDVDSIPTIQSDIFSIGQMIYRWTRT